MIASIFSPRRYLHCNHIWSKNYNNYIFVSVNYLNKCLCNIIIKNRCSMPKGYTDEKYRCNSSYHVRCTSCTCFFHYYITPLKVISVKNSSNLREWLPIHMIYTVSNLKEWMVWNKDRSLSIWLSDLVKYSTPWFKDRLLWPKDCLLSTVIVCLHPFLRSSASTVANRVKNLS